MLRIYTDAVELVRDAARLGEAVKPRSAELARQLERAAISVPLNLAEADGVRGGNRRLRNLTALGSAREVSACLDVIEALGAARVDAAMRARLDRIIGTLVRCTR
ncbi:four helix bundle protein [Sandaracinus amylolyticus]|uniref:four helix bundle protein n=1 Tax=Sandaracinus amylolyticus TaxID=927083 RepID=UPI001F3F113A|nr:four helix bundle protein [Sandaracinus amylolyticus]UJR79134.1 Four helix bundle protein [Sandaracinus amylolyticus]